MLTGLPVIENTDWSRLYHAYGPAVDTPQHLRALVAGDSAARQAAVSHLWSAIIHQGTPWTATGPAALVVVGLLSDPRLDKENSIRLGLMTFLVSVVEAPDLAGVRQDELEQMAKFDITPFLEAGDEESLYEDEDAANSFYAQAILGCIEVFPVLMDVMLAGMENSAPGVRMWAARGATLLVRTPELASHTKQVESRLVTLAEEANNTDQRSSYVLALGEIGYVPQAYLDDPSPAVRMCAALADGLATNSKALELLRHTLEQHAAEIDAWFVEKPPQLVFGARYLVIQRLIAQFEDFAHWADAAIAVVKVAELYGVDFDWGPLLVAAFPDGNGQIQTNAQRRFLQALVDKPHLWEPTFGNASIWFKQAGLPHDRAACAQRVNG